VLLTMTVHENGDLIITADNGARQRIAEERRERDFWTVFLEMTEHYWANGSYTPFDAGQANPFVGLTDTACIAEHMDAKDDGTNVVVGRLWFFEDWALNDPLEELKRRGRTVFKLAPATEEPPSTPDAHRRGYDLAEAIAAEYGIPIGELRAYASERLAEGYRERGITDGDIGTSDVSITLSQIAQHEPDALRQEAARLRERNDLVSSIAARTGRSEEETLDRLQQLLAPADPPTVPETGGRIYEYRTDGGEWVRCDLLTTNPDGTHMIEVQRLPGLREYVYDVPEERIRWSS